MFKHIFYSCLFLFVGLTDSFAQEKARDNFILFEYGLGIDGIEFNARQKVGLKWGIEFHNISGCLVSSSFMDSINELNAHTELAISNKYGEDWKKRFNQEIDDEYTQKYQLFICNKKLEDSTVVILNGKPLIRKIYSNPESFIFIEFYNLEGDKYEPTISNKSCMLDSLLNSSIKILYRGGLHTNLLDLPKVTQNISIQCSGCQLEYSEKNEIAIKAYGRAKIATLSLFKNNEVIDSIEISIKNQPKPEVHFSTSNLADTLDTSKNADSVQLFITYSPSVKMTTACFEVLSWSVLNNEKIVVSGIGNKVLPSQLKHLKKGKEYILVSKIRNNNTGIVRKITQSFYTSSK